MSENKKKQTRSRQGQARNSDLELWSGYASRWSSLCCPPWNGTPSWHSGSLRSSILTMWYEILVTAQSPNSFSPFLFWLRLGFGTGTWHWACENYMIFPSGEIVLFNLPNLNRTEMMTTRKCFCQTLIWNTYLNERV